MPLFSGMVRSVKCAWIKRIISDTFTRRGLINSLFVYKILTVNELIKHKLDIKYITFYSKFLKQVLEYWYEFYCKEPVNASEILNMNLWHNRHILIGEKPAHFKSWSNAGIVFVKDIVSCNGKLMSKYDIEQKYNLVVKQMDYNSLTHSFPRSWLNMIDCSNIETYEEIKIRLNGKLINASKTKCRDFYWDYIDSISKKPVAETKWKKYIDKEIDWENCYIIPYKICRDTTIQSFQYKIFHRFFPCQYALYTWKVENDPNCKTCNDIDYLEHTFYYCDKVKSFWNSVQNWWRSFLHFTIALSVEYVLFGIPNLDNINEIESMNLIILYGKWYIHECNAKGDVLFILDFIKLLKNKLTISKLWYRINQDCTFENKFQLLYNEL